MDIKKCDYCNMYYLANKPHFMKSSTCKGISQMTKDFREQNNIQPYEVYHFTIGTEDFLVNFQYDEQQTIRNFMRIMFNRGKKEE